MKNFIQNLAALIDADPNGIPELTGTQILQNGLNVAYFVGGAIAVIVIIVAGIMYATSGGDAANVTKAKNLILFSVIGIVVIVAAFAVTNFVLAAF